MSSDDPLFCHESIEDLEHQSALLFPGDSQFQTETPEQRVEKARALVVRNNFECLDLIGQGAYGYVFHAKSKATHFAAKVVSTVHGQGFELTKEARDLSNHSNILSIVSVIEAFHDGVAIVITPKMTSDLSRLIKSSQIPPTLAHARKLGQSLLNALSHLHRHHFVHTDVKPSNILVDLPNDQFQLGDLGECLREDTLNDNDAGYITTRWYRAPEIILEKHRKCDLDLWSAGCVLMEFITRKPLFDGSSEDAMIEMMVDCVGVPPNSYLDSCRKAPFYFSQPKPHTWTRMSLPVGWDIDERVGLYSNIEEGITQSHRPHLSPELAPCTQKIGRGWRMHSVDNEWIYRNTATNYSRHERPIVNPIESRIWRAWPGCDTLNETDTDFSELLEATRVLLSWEASERSKAFELLCHIEGEHQSECSSLLHSRGVWLGVDSSSSLSYLEFKVTRFDETRGFYAQFSHACPTKEESFPSLDSENGVWWQEQYFRTCQNIAFVSFRGAVNDENSKSATPTSAKKRRRQ